MSCQFSTTGAQVSVPPQPTLCSRTPEPRFGRLLFQQVVAGPLSNVAVEDLSDGVLGAVAH